MTIKLATAFLFATDADATLAFYRDTLNFTVGQDFSDGTFRWITVSPDGQPDLSIGLFAPAAGRSDEDGAAVAALLAKGALSGLNFAADDLDATFAAVSAAGVEITQEPTEQPWGAKDFAFVDPSGNVIRIAQA